jgi:epoxyqueuosine reductase
VDETRHRLPLADRIKAGARELGFDLVGIAPAQPLSEMKYFSEWLQAGYAGEMGYLQRQTPSRLDPRKILPEAASVVVAGIVYNTKAPATAQINDSRRGWISRYAWGDDYHELIKERLQQLDAFIKELVGDDYHSRYYTDTGPVIDRVVARHAGLGWFGKNTNLINQRLGSWFFIGEIITNVRLPFEQPPPDRCGTCRACLDACPTDAFVAPYVLDAQRCISYLTIELRGSISEDLRPQMGAHVFGCDLCQDVCPWNRKAAVTQEPAFKPRPGNLAPWLAELADLDQETFSERFKKSPIKRAKWRGLMRNVLVAMGNSGNAEFLPMIEKFAATAGGSAATDDILREHARWARERLRQNGSPYAEANETEISKAIM